MGSGKRVDRKRGHRRLIVLLGVLTALVLPIFIMVYGAATAIGIVVVIPVSVGLRLWILRS